MLCFMGFVVLSSAFILRLTGLSYKEDISDFLPLDDESHRAMKVFQRISGAENVIAIFESKDSTKADDDMMIAAVDAFAEKLKGTAPVSLGMGAVSDGVADSTTAALNVVSQIDMEKFMEMRSFVYRNMPYFLNEEDYARIDSLLSDRNYVRAQLLGEASPTLDEEGDDWRDWDYDPLNLFGTKWLAGRGGLAESAGTRGFELHDGYIFSSDMQRAFVMIGSPYGSSETEKNRELLTWLQACADSTCAEHSGIRIGLTGGPVIAVGNATQIKTDSMVSVTIAMVVIMLLLLYVFRSIRNIALIFVSIGWGWLVGLGCLAYIENEVSLIVLGISSVILGIAVNYPLHMIGHMYHEEDIRNSLREIAAPLVVGNITTVGAFMSLVPLDSVALRDFGLFSSFMLIGTIVFVLLFLPHLIKPHKSVHIPIFEKLCSISFENKPAVVAVVVMLTIVFGYFSSFTEFDSNISHINYLTPGPSPKERGDANDDGDGMERIYVVCSDETIDGALRKNEVIQGVCDGMADLTPGPSPKERGDANENENGNEDENENINIGDGLDEGTERLIIGRSGWGGFIPSKTEQERRLKMWDGFVARYAAMLKEGINKVVSEEKGFPQDSFDDFFSLLSAEYEPQDFAYFEDLAKTAFSQYYWRDSLGSAFEVTEVVTVPLSKVEEVKKALKESSAASLVFDVPSMNSGIANALSEYFNYIGWACGSIVFLFLWFSFGSIELAMLSFLPMAVSWIWILGIMGLTGLEFNIVNVILATFIFGQGDDYTIFMTEGASYEYAYRRKMLASFKSSIILSALIMLVGIGSLIVAKHPALHSLAEVTIIGMFSVVLMAYIFPPFIFNILVRKGNGYRLRPLSLGGLARGCLGWLMVALAKDGSAGVVRRGICRFCLRHMPGVSIEVRNPYNETFDSPVAIMCMGGSPLDSVILTALNATAIKGEDAVPVVIHGSDDCMPRGDVQMYPGKITVSIGKRQAQGEAVDWCTREMSMLKQEKEGAAYYASLVKDRYRYKGAEIMRTVSRHLSKSHSYPEWIDAPARSGEVLVKDAGYGEFALLYALVHKETKVHVAMKDDITGALVTHAAEGIADNLEVVTTPDEHLLLDGSDMAVLLTDIHDK